MADTADTPAYPEYRLPAQVEEYIIEQCEMQYRRHARVHLDFGHQGGLDGFVHALEGEMEVQQDVLDSDPEEICVKATGVDARGAQWRNNSIILLAPHWATDAEASLHVAEVIVMHWDRLRQIHAAVAADTTKV